MRFCQSDGTPLEQAAEPVDPYKTMVARPDEIASAIPKSSFDSPVKEPPAPVAAPKNDHDEVLQLPKEDSNKTISASEEEIRREMASHPAEEQVIEIPPLSEAPPEPPKFKEPSPPSFGGAGSAPPSPFSTPSSAPPPPRDDFGPGPDDSPFQQTSPPIPSPFNEPKPVEQKPQSFEPPKPAERTPSPFDAPKPVSQEPPPPPSFQEPEPVFQQSAGNPFDQPSAPPPAHAEWNPPPVPDAGWQNSPGAQTPGSVSPAVKSGPNSTLGLVSLILGILSFVCLGPLGGIPAIITGIMQRGKIKRNPGQYSGGGMALGGIILGVLNLLATIVVIIVYAFVIFQNINNF
jgi:hypothetical protein